MKYKIAIYLPLFCILSYWYVELAAVLFSVLLSGNITKLFNGLKLNIGTNFKDDITLSSLNDGEIYFGIQTIIKDLSGKNIYPCEIKSKTSDITDIHTLLTAAGILLISGKYHENNGILNI